MRAAMVIDVTLCERGTQPAHQRSAASVGGERAAPLTVTRSKAVEFGVELISQIAAERLIACDGDGRASERLAINLDEMLPRAFVPTSAGARENKVGKAKGLEECGLLVARCDSACRHAEVRGDSCLEEDLRTLLLCEPPCCCVAGMEELCEQFWIASRRQRVETWDGHGCRNACCAGYGF
jgi:hypothetical protein